MTDKPETPHPMSEEEIRELVRREIAEREKLRKLEKQVQQERDQALEDIDLHRKIIEEEKRKFYESNPDYHEYINEIGEVEWLTTEEMRAREQLFDDEIEELESGKKRAQIVLFLVFGLFLATVAVIITLLSEKTGSIQVISNIKGANIILDSAPAEQLTDAIFTDIPVGKHVISVQKAGYKIQGDQSRTVDVKSKEREIAIFTLTPDLSDNLGSDDRIKTIFSDESKQDTPGSSTNP
jgi:hypothetical protein